MLQGAAYHAGHGSDCFQHNGPMAVPMREKGVGHKQQALDDTISNPIGRILRDVVSLERERVRHAGLRSWVLDPAPL
jgi:hypothetical protein